MGLFSKKCAVCGADCGMNYGMLKDKQIICMDCQKRAGLGLFGKIPKKTTLQEVKDILFCSSGHDDIEFSPTKTIANVLSVDDKTKRFYADGKLCDYADLVSFELLEDGNTVTSGGAGSAIAGGLVFGGVGAITGGIVGKKKTKNTCSSLRVKITIRDMEKPTLYLEMLSGKLAKEVEKSSSIYKNAYRNAQECLSVLQLIYDEKDPPKAEPAPAVESSGADEIMKYKNLLDIGAITQEEFDAKKKQLLGL